MHALAVHFPREAERTRETLLVDLRHVSVDLETPEERSQFGTGDRDHGKTKYSTGKEGQSEEGRIIFSAQESDFFALCHYMHEPHCFQTARLNSNVCLVEIYYLCADRNLQTS
jgi:hypothetical protein